MAEGPWMLEIGTDDPSLSKLIKSSHPSFVILYLVVLREVKSKE